MITNFNQKPTPSAGCEKQGDGWLVVTQNMDDKQRQERFFYSEAEARAYWHQEVARVNAAR